MRRTLLFLLIWLEISVGLEVIPELDDFGLITGLSVEGSENFESLQVYVGSRRDIAISGKTKRLPHSFLFTPDFKLDRGLEYNLVLKGEKTETVPFSLEKPPPQKAYVKNILPTSSQLPENILRFYIEFTQPMKEGNFLDYIHLAEEGGEEDMTGVFFDNVYELWNHNHTKLTILVDPGRVKTGLYANQQWGRAFRNGKTYHLSVKTTWPTLEGGTLSERYTKTFVATTEDFDPVCTDSWSLTAPKAGTKHPLILEFPKPMDHISALSYFSVLSSENKKEVPGYMEMSNNETFWLFTPVSPWEGKDFKLRINSRLEDVVGNNLNGAFDHKIGSLKSEKEGEIVELDFALK